MEFEDILVKVGNYGNYQKKLLGLYLLPTAILLPWFSMNNLFFISTPDHWCRVPELEDFNLTNEQVKSLIRPPKDPSCQMYDVNYTHLLISSPDSNWTIPENTSTKSCTNGWNFDKTNFEYTAATQNASEANFEYGSDGIAHCCPGKFHHRWGTRRPRRTANSH